MSDRVSDEAFARHLVHIRLVTSIQIDTARDEQAELAKRGVTAPLADVLVRQGLITPAIRENVEKTIQAQQAGGIQRLGQYKLLKRLGEGGMGAVYLAEDVAMSRRVALKVLAKQHSGNAEFLARFRREAMAAGQLNHVNIVTAYAVGEEMGHHFFVMEYCEGESLERRLQREGRLPWDRAVEIIMQVARGLKHAHENGFVHRDIKPANIIVTTQGVAKILDLGVSRSVSESAHLTQTAVAVGTPHYMSPEQARGEKEIDARTDIYSLGATFYHLVTGQTPFQGSSAAVIMMKHFSEQLPNPQDLAEDLPGGVAHVIRKAMAKEAADRYADCKELLGDLELVIDGKAPASAAVEAHKSTVPLRARLPSPPRGEGRVAARGVPLSPARRGPTRVPPPTGRVRGEGEAAGVPAPVIHPAGDGASAAPPSAGQTPIAPTQFAAAPMVPRKRGLFIAVGAAAVVLAALGLALLLRSSNTAPAVPAEVQPKKATEPSATATARAELDEMFRYVQDSAKNNPSAYDELEQRYHKVAERAQGTGFELEIQDKVDAALAELRTRQSAAAQAAWKPIEQSAREKAKAGDYDAALAVVVAPHPFGELLRSRGEQLTQEFRAEAQGKMQAALTAAEEAAGKGDPEEGQKALAPVMALKYAPLSETVAAMGRRLTNDLANVGELREKREVLAAQKKLAEYLAQFDEALLEKGDAAAAAAVAAGARRDCTHKAVQPIAAALDELLTADAAARRREAHALKALVGKPLAVGKETGTVKEVIGAVLAVEIRVVVGAGSATMLRRVKLSELNEEQRMQILGAGAPPTDAAKALAAAHKLKKDQEDLAGAEALLNEAKAFPLTAHFLRLIAERRRALAELAAEKAWDAADKLFAAKDLEAARAAYEAFTRDHAKTQAAANHAAALKERCAAMDDLLFPRYLVLDLGDGVKMEFVLIPAGSFIMGSGKRGEGPLHDVVISKRFYVGKYEVTQQQYVRLMGRNPSSFRDGPNAPRRPVERVSWEDANGFCERLSQMAKGRVRLPTEAEWEYACRAGTKTTYSWGDDSRIVDEFVWWRRNSEATTHPVGQKKPNPWGLHDMHGNVCEWCADDFHGSYEEAPADGRAWVDQTRAANRVLRGASFDFNADVTSYRSTVRQGMAPGIRNSTYGFRCVMDVPPAVPQSPAPSAVPSKTTPPMPPTPPPPPAPKVGAWPLHDGREPIAEYARKLKVLPEAALDLGGGEQFLGGSPEGSGRKRLAAPVALVCTGLQAQHCNRFPTFPRATSTVPAGQCHQWPSLRQATRGPEQMAPRAEPPATAGESSSRWTSRGGAGLTDSLSRRSSTA